MLKRTRCNHAPTFKTKETLAALKGDCMMAEPSVRFSVHANQIGSPKWITVIH